ncbi:MAG: OB-fold domain-containing protein [Actinomycetota bacterium]|nr:OB-fold domain-containing protein [Actinomycetota bacterium]
MSAGERIRAAAAQIAAAGDSARRPARDPVNEPMVRNWVEALDDRNPVYVDRKAAEASVHQEPVAPPAMIQVWTMPGLRPDPGLQEGDPLRSMMAALDAEGFTSVVATDSEQSYYRYLRMGEHLEVSTRLEEVVGPKRTGLGEGWFVTTVSTWWVGDEAVGRMRFKVLKFRPKDEPQQAAAGQVLRPAVNRDTAFFWEGTGRGELRIQRCDACGSLRHPPGPLCTRCGSTDRGHVVASGRGTVYSYVVHHHPPVPGKALPLVIVLVELEEGVRMLGELLDADPDAVRIGQPVLSRMERVDDDLTLPAWVPADAEERP